MNSVVEEPVPLPQLSEDLQISDEPVPLPQLREDLQILEGPVANSGAPTWNIFDPICNKYFRIGWSAFQLISLWNLGSVGALIEQISKNTNAKIEQSDVEELISFLQANNLTRDSATGSSSAYMDQYLATKTTWYMWLVKNYLFVRIPIFKPRQFLKRTLPLVEPLYSKPFCIGMVIVGILGLYLVARQWESFVSTFPISLI